MKGALASWPQNWAQRKGKNTEFHKVVFVDKYFISNYKFQLRNQLMKNLRMIKF